MNSSVLGEISDTQLDQTPQLPIGPEFMVPTDGHFSEIDERVDEYEKVPEKKTQFQNRKDKLTAKMEQKNRPYETKSMIENNGNPKKIPGDNEVEKSPPQTTKNISVLKENKSLVNLEKKYRLVKPKADSDGKFQPAMKIQVVSSKRLNLLRKNLKIYQVGEERKIDLTKACSSSDNESD